MFCDSLENGSIYTLEHVFKSGGEKQECATGLRYRAQNNVISWYSFSELRNNCACSFEDLIMIDYAVAKKLVRIYLQPNQ